MLMFPYILNLLAAMLLGALIGAERQWRQRMAGLRTNALVATGAAVFILSSMTTSPDSPGELRRRLSLVLAFWGGRHYARRDECARTEHCGNAMVFGGHRRVMRLRAVQKCAGGDDHYSLCQYFIA